MRFVKSYQGKRPDTQEVEINSFHVKDYMATRLITFRPEQSVHEAIATLLRNRISGAPVVDEDMKLVGIISEGDCLKQISECRYHNHPLSETKIEQCMAKHVQTIDGEMNIFDAASKFLSSRIRRFPVVKDGKLVGQISQKDIMKAVLDHKGNTWNKEA